MGTYRLGDSYQSNYDLGPDFRGSFPAVPETTPKQFLGRTIRSRLGISAGLLLNSKWIETYSKLGFDLLTYKTVRSRHRPCYPVPNWVAIEADGGLTEDDDRPMFAATPLNPPLARGEVKTPLGPSLARGDVERDSLRTWAVCFGMPSMAPDVWRADVERSRRLIASDQLLCVSVVGTPDENSNADDLADDFARCGRWAADSGADIVEANFSCPNVCSAEGQIYQSPAASQLVAERVRAAIGSVPLMVKVGHVASDERLLDLLRALNGVVDAVVMVNGIQRPVRTQDGKPAFGEYERVGIVGAAIHQASVDLVRRAAALIAKEGLALAIVGNGGVTGPSDAKRFLDAGAEAVLLGSYPMVKPTVAVEIKSALPEI